MATVITLLVISEVVLLFYSWNFYLNHYPKRALVIHAWECGYKQLSNYIQKHEKTRDVFYITRKNGQPYIHLLFHLKYDPSTYQKQAILSSTDKYGFGQVKGFDKYIFEFQKPDLKKRFVLVGSPDDFIASKIKYEKQQIEKIEVGNEDIFWIYRSPVTAGEK